MRRAFIPAVQAYIARASITASTVRGPGSAGTASCAREFLASLGLKQFGVSNERMFTQRLDRATQSLLDDLPVPARKWGRARKVVNIFLRNAFYSRYLSRRFDLDRAESLFELPLDNMTACKLRAGSPNLPYWPGVAALTRDISQAYQMAAEKEARNRGQARVHLDVYWFGGERRNKE